jgi:hypothetical protein
MSLEGKDVARLQSKPKAGDRFDMRKRYSDFLEDMLRTELDLGTSADHHGTEREKSVAILQNIFY